LLLASGLWQAFGIQALVWGAVDAAIAAAGLVGARRWARTEEKNAGTERSGPTGRAARARRGAEQRGPRLRRVLWINTGLDVLYVGAGIGLAALFGDRGTHWLGHGWGVAVQGAFLLVFDLIHAQSVPYPSRPPLQAFSAPEHRPFDLPSAQGQPGGPGALLVHGFPGTPAEMRPLAEVLQREGWSVRALLLPGFGPQIARIADFRWPDWREAVHRALAEMRARHRPLLLVGYSLGGALSAAAVGQAAEADRPDGLVLLAPFWRLGSAVQRLIGSVLVPFLPRTFQPLAKADFSDPRLLDSLRQFVPGLDVTDPDVQRQLREARVPLSIVRQIFAAGARAFGRRNAGRIALPTLVVQGKRDTLVRAARTCRLLPRLGGHPLYREVEAGHDLVDPRSPGWPELSAQVREFASGLRGSRPPS
jgi:carboxylesterase